jgi:preprotein translocase SecE subunit
VARDRQRAKQRKARRAAQNPGPAPSQPHRADLPGELEHASGEVDEFDAALVAGAGGRPLDDPEPGDAEPRDADLSDADLAAEALEAEPLEEIEGEPVDDAFAEDDGAPFDDDEMHEDDERRPVAAGAVPPSRTRRGAGEARAPGAPTPRGPARFTAFLRASWAELQRVQWPDRRQVAQATAVVLGFVVVAGLYLGIADKVAQELVDFIL